MNVEQKIDKLIEEATRFSKEISASSPDRRAKLETMANVHANQRLYNQGMPSEQTYGMPLRKKMQLDVPKNYQAKLIKDDPEYQLGDSPTLFINPKNKEEVGALKEGIKKVVPPIIKDGKELKPASHRDFFWNKLSNEDLSYQDHHLKKIDDLIQNPQKFRPQRDEGGKVPIEAIAGKYRNEFIRRDNKYFQTDMTPHIYKEARFGLDQMKVLPGKNLQWLFVNPDQGQKNYEARYAASLADKTGDVPVRITGRVPLDKMYSANSPEFANERMLTNDDLGYFLRTNQIKEEPYYKG